MKPGLDVRVDYAFERVFGSEDTTDTLISLLNAVIQPPPGQEVTGVELRNPFSDKDAPDDKLAVLDVKARDGRGRWFNVEMQMAAPTLYLRRVLFYWAQTYQGQMKEGDDFSVLRPVISISFLNGRRFHDEPDFHHVFQLRGGREGKLLLTEDLAIHLIELPKFDLTPEQLTRPLHLWCYFLRHAAELNTDTLPARLDVRAVRRALEVLGMMSHDDREREIYEGRLKARRDRAAELQDASDEGRKEGHKEGRKEGRAEGESIGRILTLQELLGLPPMPREQLEAMAAEDLAKLAAELQQRMKAR
jgi:predicted transposase/invertase (TIGR01784 family)